MELQRGGPLARAAMPLRIRSTGLTGHDELKSGRRLYFLNLILLTGMGLTLCLCLAASSFSLKVEATKAVLTLPVLAVAGLSPLSIKRKWGARLGFVSLAIGQFGFISMFAAPLTYVAAAANLPLQDANLAYLDRLLGLDWPAYFSYATLHPVLLDYASVVYFAIWLPGVGVPLVLGLWGQYVRLQQFVTATILTICVVILVSALLPALGTYYQYNLPADTDLFEAYGYLAQIKDLPLVRDGTLRLLELLHLGGIITFPSFHAAAGILAIWGFWGIWWMRPPALIINLAMLLATPLVGGHYFVDVIAGAAVALAAIEVTKAMSACSGIVRQENLSASCLALRPEPRNLLQKWVESITRVGGWTMKKSRFTEEQIIAILREQEAGAATADVCRKHGVSSATFYKWKAKYGGLEVSDAKRTHTEYDRSDALKAMH